MDTFVTPSDLDQELAELRASLQLLVYQTFGGVALGLVLATVVSHYWK